MLQFIGRNFLWYTFLMRGKQYPGAREALGDQMRRIREEKGMTQAEVAEKAGIHVNFYARVERGKENPSHDVIDSVARVLKVKLNIPS